MKKLGELKNYRYENQQYPNRKLHGINSQSEYKKKQQIFTNQICQIPGKQWNNWC